MKMTVLDTIERKSKSGKPFVQAALRGEGKKGSFLFVATVPDDLNGAVGEVVDLNVVFSRDGMAYVLPY